MTIHWKAFEKQFTVVLLGFQFYPVCNCRKFINVGFGTFRSERVNVVMFMLLCFALYCVVGVVLL